MYCSQDDIDVTLPLLKDLWGTGRIPTEAQVAAIIARQSNLIDSYLVRIDPHSFTLPLAEPPELVTQICVWLTTSEVLLTAFQPAADSKPFTDAQEYEKRALRELLRLSTGPEAGLFPALAPEGGGNTVGTGLSTCPDPFWQDTTDAEGETQW